MTPTKKSTAKVDLVKERCVLVHFGAGYFNWKRRDRSAEREYSESKGVSSSTFETKKNIFSGCDAVLADVKSLVNEARAYHYDVTLPWQHGHSATLANGLVPKYRETVAAFQNRMDLLNDQISVEWPTMIENAKRSLGPSFQERDYLPLHKVLAANYVRAKYSPVGSGDDIRSTLDGAADDALDEIREEINEDTRQAYDAAIKALWERLYDILEVASKNLQKTNSDDGRFRTEWYDNLQSLLPCLDHLNLNDDPRIGVIKTMAEKLVEHDIGDLKDEVDTRQSVAEEADKVFQKVSGIFTAMGGKG